MPSEKNIDTDAIDELKLRVASLELAIKETTEQSRHVVEVSSAIQAQIELVRTLVTEATRNQTVCTGELREAFLLLKGEVNREKGRLYNLEAMSMNRDAASGENVRLLTNTLGEYPQIIEVNLNRLSLGDTLSLLRFYGANLQGTVGTLRRRLGTILGVHA